MTQRRNIFEQPYLSSGENFTPCLLDEITEILERVNCCTLGQMTDYINAVHRSNRDVYTSHVYSPREIYVVIVNDHGLHVKAQENDSKRGPLVNRIVYLGKYMNLKELHRETIHYGIAKMATIIPFLPESRAVYDISAPLSFMFFKGGKEIQVAVIQEGQEVTACRVLSEMRVPKSVDLDTVLRIAIVKNESNAYSIYGGGFESVCVITEENKLKQVRTIPKDQAWPD